MGKCESAPAERGQVVLHVIEHRVYENGFVRARASDKIGPGGIWIQLRAAHFSAKRIVLWGLLLPLVSAASAGAGESPSGGRRVGPRALAVWAAPGVSLDVAPYGLEKWSPGLFVKVRAQVAGALALSVRPSLLLENRAFALRAAVTLDLLPGKGRNKIPGGRPHGESGVRGRARPVEPSPYLGEGLACYRNGSYILNRLISCGVDVGFLKRFVFMGGGDLLLERGDTSLEMLGGFGISIR